MTDAAEITRDGFLNGAVSVFQPATGYRAGMDAVMLAAALDDDRGGSIAEAGCGAGAALLCAAHRLTTSALTGFEQDPAMAGLALKSAAENNLTDRVRVEVRDIRERRSLPEGRFDQAFANPPFFAPGRVRQPGAGREKAYLADAPLRDWILFLLHAVKAGGRVTLIHRAAALADILELLNSRAGEISVLPVRPSPEEAAKRVLVRARKGLRRGDVKLLAGLDLHKAPGGELTERASAILTGAALDWR